RRRRPPGADRWQAGRRRLRRPGRRSARRAWWPRACPGPGPGAGVPGCGDEVMSADEYAAIYGPTAGDTIALGHTGLVVRVEADAQRRGEEFLLGFGKTARDGMHLAPVSLRESCDLVVSNVVILDALLGVRKASIGVRDGRIVAIGRAGNPDTLDGVDVVV